MSEAQHWAEGSRKAEKAVECLPQCGELSRLLSPFLQSSLHMVMELEGMIFAYKVIHQIQKVVLSYDYSSALEGLSNTRQS